jgi:CRP-like cAMP-binding protein
MTPRSDFMKELFADFLHGFPMLTKAEVDIIVESTNIQSFMKGRLLLRQGQVASKCYLVLRGLVREYHLKDGEEKTTAFFMEGDSITAFTSQSKSLPSKRDLICAEDCILTVSNQEIEKEIYNKIPRLESVVLHEVEKAMGQIQDELSAFISSSPEERYTYLIKHKPQLLNRVPQHQIASYIGIQPQSLSRLRRRILDKG